MTVRTVRFVRVQPKGDAFDVDSFEDCNTLFSNSE